MEKKSGRMSEEEALAFLQNNDSNVAIAVVLLPLKDGDKTGYAATVAIDKNLDTTAMAASVSAILKVLAAGKDSEEVMEMLVAALDDDEEDQLWS